MELFDHYIWEGIWAAVVALWRIVVSNGFGRIGAAGGAFLLLVVLVIGVAGWVTEQVVQLVAGDRVARRARRRLEHAGGFVVVPLAVLVAVLQDH